MRGTHRKIGDDLRAERQRIVNSIRRTHRGTRIDLLIACENALADTRPVGCSVKLAKSTVMQGWCEEEADTRWRRILYRVGWFFIGRLFR